MVYPQNNTISISGQSTQSMADQHDGEVSDTDLKALCSQYTKLYKRLMDIPGQLDAIKNMVDLSLTDYVENEVGTKEKIAEQQATALMLNAEKDMLQSFMSQLRTKIKDGLDIEATEYAIAFAEATERLQDKREILMVELEGVLYEAIKLAAEIGCDLTALAKQIKGRHYNELKHGGETLDFELSRRSERLEDDTRYEKLLEKYISDVEIINDICQDIAWRWKQPRNVEKEQRDLESVILKSKHNISIKMEA